MSNEIENRPLYLTYGTYTPILLYAKTAKRQIRFLLLTIQPIRFFFLDSVIHVTFLNVQVSLPDNTYIHFFKFIITLYDGLS